MRTLFERTIFMFLLAYPSPLTLNYLLLTFGKTVVIFNVLFSVFDIRKILRVNFCVTAPMMPVDQLLPFYHIF